MKSVSTFRHCFRQRLTDCRRQDWEGRMNSSDRFSFYRNFKKSHHDTAVYFLMDMDTHVRNALSKFRFGISYIAICMPCVIRYTHLKIRYQICPLCNETVENEVQFSVCCTALDDHYVKDIFPIHFLDNLALLEIKTHRG